MTSSIQYLTTAHNGYILPSDTAQMEHYAAPGGVHLTMAHNGVAGGVQKLVAVQPMAGATQQRAAGPMQAGGGTTIYHSGMQKFVALQPMAVPNGAQRTYAGGTTYLHQAAPQPRPQQLAAGTQIINAFNAEGQPVTIAINPNGTHSVLSSSTLTMPSNGQPVQSQQVQMRQVPGATTLITSQGQGQRIVQLPNGEFQAVQAGGAPGIYKVVQQGGPVQAGDRFVVQTNQGQQLVQRFMPSQGTTVPIKQANGVPQMAVRSTAAPVATMMAQPSSIQMGRSLIHMPSRPSTTTTAYTTAAPVQTMRPNPNILGMAKLPQAKQPIKQMQQMQQLPSTILVRPAGSTDTGLGQVLQQQASGTASLQPQSVQQQVKDTAAQQRQQQLLASLRARVASLHHVQGGQAVLRPAGMPQAQTVIGPGGQIRRLVAVGEQPTGPATTAMHLQPDGNLAQRVGSVMVNGNGQHQTQHSSIDSQSLLSLTPAQQQALMSGQSLDSQGMMVSQLVDDNQALLAGQTMEQQAMMARQQAERQALAQQQRNAMREAMINSGNEEASQALAPGQLVLMPSSGSSVNTPSPTTMLSRGLDGKSIQRPFGQPASPSGSVGKEDLRAILLSIGAELARHGIDVETAVDAGWLGVLSPTDVAVLQEAYAMEERNLAMEGPEARSRMGREASQASFGVDEHGRMPTLEANSFIRAGSITSRGSPAASIMSNGVLDAVWTPPADPPMQLTDIDDARFSAFAYDFFGSHDTGGVAPNDFLEALEPDAAGKFNRTVSAMAGSAGSGHSSIATAPPGDGVVAPPIRAAPVRAPSWPSANKPGPTGPLQVDDQSMASFSDMCTASMPVNGANHEAGSDSVSTSSSNQELVARIANLDLGCGFY